MNHELDLSPALTVDSISLPLNAYAIFHFCNKPIKIQTLDIFNLGHLAIREVFCDNNKEERSDLDHLDHAAEGKGEREEDEHDGDHDQEVGADPLTLLTGCK